MSEATIIGERRSRQEPRTPKPEPIRCPGCGGIPETGPTEAGTLIAVCTNPVCAAWTLYRRAESGIWIVAERIGRDRRQSDRPDGPGPVGPAAG